MWVFTFVSLLTLKNGMLKPMDSLVILSIFSCYNYGQKGKLKLPSYISEITWHCWQMNYFSDTCCNFIATSPHRLVLVTKRSQEAKTDKYNCAETWPAFSHWPTCSQQHGIVLQFCSRRCYFSPFSWKKDKRSAHYQKLVFSFMQKITIILQLTDISKRHTLKISEDSCSENTAMHSDLLHGIRPLKKNLDNVLEAWNSEIQWYSDMRFDSWTISHNVYSF